MTRLTISSRSAGLDSAIISVRATKVVEGDRFIRIRNVQKMHIAFFVNLALQDGIADMFSDDRALLAEEV